MSAEEEKKKREIFESMAPRRQQRVLKKGYDKWDPFLQPKEPPFFREQDRRGFLDAADWFARFLRHQEEQRPEAPLTPLQFEGAREICFGLVKDRAERYQGMLDFCRWFSSQSVGRE